MGSAARRWRRRSPLPRVGIVGLELQTGNPYLDRLAGALRAAGAEVSPLTLTPRRVLRARRDGLAVAHVQWPEYLLRASTRAGASGRLREALSLARLASALVLCRLIGVRVVWTVHNLQPHDPLAPWFALRAYRLVGALAQSFVVHSQDAADRTIARFPRAAGRTVVAPHGDYHGAYRPSGPGGGAAIRAKHGISSTAIVLLAFGQVRAYKRLDELARLVAGIAPDVHLLIVGAPVDAAHAAAIEAVASQHPRIHVELRRVADEDVAGFYAAADFAVLHYAEVFSSGALLLALSQGVAVLTPASRAAEEVAGPPALFTYEGDDLTGALRRALRSPSGARCSAALAASSAASWDLAAERVLKAYGSSTG